MLRGLGALVALFVALGFIALASQLGTVDAAKGGKVVPFAWQSVVWTDGPTSPVEQQTDWTTCCNVALTPVEQWVSNPVPGCAWDVDDDFSRFGGGDLTAAQVVSNDLCLMADGNPWWGCHYGTCAYWSGARARYSLSVTAPSPDLLVEACFAPQGRCFTLVPALVNGLYRYERCLGVVYTGGATPDPALVEIPGSAGSALIVGGFAVQTTITGRVTNPTGMTARDVWVTTEIVGVGRSGGGCLFSELVSPDGADYPFLWWLS